MNRFKRDRLYKSIYGEVFYHTNGFRPKAPLSKCKITIVRHYYRFLDWDGCVGSMKPIIDGLIHAKIIKDDSYKVTGPWDVTQEFLGKKEGGRIYLRIDEK